MSSRIGDESGRARAESLDPVVAAGGDGSVGERGSRGSPRCGGSAGTRRRWSAWGSSSSWCSPASCWWSWRRARPTRPRDAHVGAVVVALVRHRPPESRLAVAGAPRRAGVVEGRVRDRGAVHADRRRDRRARGLPPRVARRPAHAIHRSLDRAAGDPVPRRGGVDRHRRPRPARAARPRQPARHHAPALVPPVGLHRACRAWRHAGAARAGVRRRRAASARRTRGSSCAT